MIQHVQHFALFLTVIVLLLDYHHNLGFCSQRTVHEFIEEWKKKLESVEENTKKPWNPLK